MSDPRPPREGEVEEATARRSGLGDDWLSEVSDVGEELDAPGATQGPGIFDRLGAEPGETRPVEPNGPIAAALVSAGIGCASLGVLVVVAEAFESVSKFLSFYDPAGSLSGKTTVATLAWLLAWPLLHSQLRDREIDMKRAVRWTWILVAVGLVGTFPPFFQLFARSE